MFHQGVARRSESSLDPRLKQRTRRVKLFMAFNHSLPAAQGPAMTRERSRLSRAWRPAGEASLRRLLNSMCVGAREP